MQKAYSALHVTIVYIPVHVLPLPDDPVGHVQV